MARRATWHTVALNSTINQSINQSIIIIIITNPLRSPSPDWKGTCKYVSDPYLLEVRGFVY